MQDVTPDFPVTISCNRSATFPESFFEPAVHHKALLFRQESLSLELPS